MKSIMKKSIQIAIFATLGTAGLGYAGPQVQWINYFKVNNQEYQVRIHATCDNGHHAFNKALNYGDSEYHEVPGCDDDEGTMRITLTAIKDGGDNLFSQTIQEDYSRKRNNYFTGIIKAGKQSASPDSMTFDLEWDD